MHKIDHPEKIDSGAYKDYTMVLLKIIFYLPQDGYTGIYRCTYTYIYINYTLCKLELSRRVAGLHHSQVAPAALHHIILRCPFDTHPQSQVQTGLDLSLILGWGWYKAGVS